MFEGWLRQLVAGYLGNYIKDIQFRIGLWKGVAVVENAELRLEAFDYLQLPFAIRKGFVGKLRLQIPWKTLFWEPIVVSLENVYICAGPRDDSEFDVKTSEDRALAAKKSKLAAAEITKLSSRVTDDKVRYSLISHLLEKLIANIQVTVGSIHIQYIDDKHDACFNFGMKLAGLTCATDARATAGISVVGKPKTNVVQKSIDVTQLALYWNPCSKIQASNHGDSEEPMYILQPMDASSRLTVSKSDGAGSHYALTVSVNKLDVSLKNLQLTEMVSLLKSMKVSRLRERYGRFRPRILPWEDRAHWQRLWWHYAIQAVLSDVRKRLRRNSWNYLAWRLDHRRRYVTLYKEKLDSFQEGKPPSDDVLNELEELERELDLDVILSFRSLVEEKLNKPFADTGRAEPDPESPNSVDNKRTDSRGWLSLFSFGMLGGSGTMDAAAESTGHLSEEIMKDLCEATNFRPSQLTKDKEDIFLAMRVRLHAVVVRLGTVETEDFLEANLLGCSASVRKLQKSLNAAVAVSGIDVKDICTVHSSPDSVTAWKALFGTVKPKTYAEAAQSRLPEPGFSQLELSEAACLVTVDFSEEMKIAVVLSPMELVYNDRVFLSILRIVQDLRQVCAALDLTETSERSDSWTKVVATIRLNTPRLLIQQSGSAQSSAAMAVSTESLHVTFLNMDAETTTYDLKFEGLQFGVNVEQTAWTHMLEPLDANVRILESTLSEPDVSHWEVDVTSGPIRVVVSSESCKLVKESLRDIARGDIARGDIARGDPSPQPAKTMVLHHFVENATFQVQLDSFSALHLDFKAVELKLVTDVENEQVTVAVGSLCITDTIHHSLVDGTGHLACTYISSRRDGFYSAQLLLNLADAHCHVHPRAAGSCFGFLESVSQEDTSWSNHLQTAGDSFLFQLMVHLRGISFTLHYDFEIAEISFPSFDILLSSSGNTWELEGCTTGAQLNAPSFATQGVEGIPFGSIVNGSSSLQLKLVKQVTSSANTIDIFVGLENVECILVSDYLAVLIGFFTSPDWAATKRSDTISVSPTQGKTVVPYKVEVRESLLIVPSGRGSFAAVSIPEFTFQYFPCAAQKRFQISGNRLSLTNFGLAEEAPEARRCLPLIRCLSGEINIKVPLYDENPTEVQLQFPVLDVSLIGKEFRRQYEAIVIFSEDVSMVGKKSSYVSKLWTYLQAGSSFVLQPEDGDAQAGPSLHLCCCIHELRVAVCPWQAHAGTVQTILTGQALSVVSYCTIDSGVVESMTLDLNEITLLDGWRKTSLLDRVYDRAQKLDALAVPLEGKPLLTAGLEGSPVACKVNEEHIGILLPRLQVWLRCASWESILGWIFESFPELTYIAGDSTSSMSVIELRADIPRLSLYLEEYDGEKVMCLTSALCIEKVVFSSSGCSFSAVFSHLRAEAREGNGSKIPWLSGGDIVLNGDYKEPASMGLFVAVSSVDCWWSYPLQQFVSNFRMEPLKHDGEGVGALINAKVEVKSASLLLTDGRWNYNCPLFELIASDFVIELKSSDISDVRLSSALEISYHNFQKAVWEPFLEPCSFSMSISAAYSPHSKKVDVKSLDEININVTEGLSEAMKRATEMFTWSGVNGHRNNFSQYAPYWFQNDTGIAVSYLLIWPASNEGDSNRLLSAHLGWRKVPPGEAVPLLVEESEGYIRRRSLRWKCAASEGNKIGLMSHRRLCIRLEGTAAASLPMSIDLVGTRAFEVVFSKTTSQEVDDRHRSVYTTRVLFQVSLQHHSKLIRLFSTVSLTNMTTVALEALLEIPFSIAPKVLQPLGPNDVIALPVHLAESGGIRFRPHEGDFLWSEAVPLSKLIEQRNSMQRPVLCYPCRPSKSLFRCCIAVEGNLVPDVSLTNSKRDNLAATSACTTWNIKLHAPLVIENGIPYRLEIEVESGSGGRVHYTVPELDSVYIYELDAVNDLTVEVTVPDFMPNSFKLSRANESGQEEVMVLQPSCPSGRPVYASVDKRMNLSSGRREVRITAAYWIYNLSGLDLIFMDGHTGGQEVVLLDANSTTSPKTSDNGLLSVLNEPMPPPSNDELFPPAYLYSPERPLDVHERRMLIRVNNASWSQPFLLDPPDGSSAIIVPQEASNGAYALSVSSMPALGAAFTKTKTITFRPRFVLANTSRKEICFRQQGTRTTRHLGVGQNLPVHWSDTTRPLFLSVRYNEHGWDWSGGFSLDRLGDTQVKIHNHRTGVMEILRVEVSNFNAGSGGTVSSTTERHGTFYIILANDETGFTPFRIENFSTERLRFYQKGCVKRENILQPYSSYDYAWDEPFLPPQLVVEVLGEGPLGSFELETVRSYPIVHFHGSAKVERRFSLSVHAEGARRVLSVVDLNVHTQRDIKASPKLGHRVTPTLEEFSLSMFCVGISLVDSAPQELIFVSARGVKVLLTQSDSEQELRLEIARLQADNQMRGAVYPVMLLTPVPSTRLLNMIHPEQHADKPAIVLFVTKWRHPTGSVDCFQSILLRIAPVRLELEEQNLARLIDSLKSLVVSKAGPEFLQFRVNHLGGVEDSKNIKFLETSPSELHKSWPSPFAVERAHFCVKKISANTKHKRKLYVAAFCVDPLELNVSFSTVPWQSNPAREAAPKSILWISESSLQRHIIALADVEAAPIRLRQLTLSHSMSNWNALAVIIQRHYMRQLLQELYKVLGSADVFGNPVSFMRSLGIGVLDFVSAPVRSIKQNPVNVVHGVRLGTKSLVKHTVFAFSNTATQMSKAARKGVAALASDREHLNNWPRESSVVNEFLEGLTGLLQSSVRGAERHGIPGIFSGTAVGMLRAVARPAASMLEVAGKTAQSIRNSSRPLQAKISRARLPRHLDAGSPLLPYSWKEAVAMDMLVEAEAGRLKDEVYVTCQPLAETGKFVLLTEEWLHQLRKGKGASEEEVAEGSWSVTRSDRVEDVLHISSRGGGGVGAAEEELNILFCSPLFCSWARRGFGSSSLSSSSRWRPLTSVTLRFCCAEDAEEVRRRLRQLWCRKQQRHLPLHVKLED